MAVNIITPAKTKEAPAQKIAKLNASIVITIANNRAKPAMAIGSAIGAAKMKG